MTTPGDPDLDHGSAPADRPRSTRAEFAAKPILDWDTNDWAAWIEGGPLAPAAHDGQDSGHAQAVRPAPVSNPGPAPAPVADTPTPVQESVPQGSEASATDAPPEPVPSPPPRPALTAPTRSGPAELGAGGPRSEADTRNRWAAPTTASAAVSDRGASPYPVAGPPPRTAPQRAPQREQPQRAAPPATGPRRQPMASRQPIDLSRPGTLGGSVDVVSSARVRSAVELVVLAVVAGALMAGLVAIGLLLAGALVRAAVT